MADGIINPRLRYVKAYVVLENRKGFFALIWHVTGLCRKFYLAHLSWEIVIRREHDERSPPDALAGR